MSKYTEIENFNNDLCYPIVLIQAFRAHGININMEEAKSIVNYKEEAENWPYHSFSNISKYGFEVSYFDDYNYQAMYQNVYKAFENLYGEETTKNIFSKTNVNTLQNDIRECVDNPNVNIVESLPTHDRVKELMKDGFMVILFPNYYLLNTKRPESYATHAVLLVDHGESEYTVYDPGPPKAGERVFMRAQFWEAMYYPLEKSATLVAIRPTSHLQTSK